MRIWRFFSDVSMPMWVMGYIDEMLRAGCDCLLCLVDVLIDAVQEGPLEDDHLVQLLVDIV
jgi:hypothetical protein